MGGGHPPAHAVNGFGDERRELHTTHSIQGKLAVFLALAFGYGWSVLAFDLSMGMSLHFQSTLYGWWFFMGGWLCSLTLLTLLTLAWRRFLGAEEYIRENIFHDLGKLCFAFTAFWGYLTFGQYLVLWYGNLGEETHWPRIRLIEPWVRMTVSAVLMVFFLPFFGLISKRGEDVSARRSLCSRRSASSACTWCAISRCIRRFMARPRRSRSASGRSASCWDSSASGARAT